MYNIITIKKRRGKEKEGKLNNVKINVIIKKKKKKKKLKASIARYEDDRQG